MARRAMKVTTGGGANVVISTPQGTTQTDLLPPTEALSVILTL